jgi:hypothetical protein
VKLGEGPRGKDLVVFQGGEDHSRLKTILRFFNWFLDVFPGSKYKMKGSFVKANKGFSIKLITITMTKL